jgi:hypothetical protein
MQSEPTQDMQIISGQRRLEHMQQQTRQAL